MTQPIFEERQRPPAGLVIVGLAISAFAIAFGIVVSDRIGHLRWQLFYAPALALAVVTLVRMTTIVTAHYVRVTILPFPRKTFPVAEIAGCEVVTYRPFLEYGGWGWRWSVTRGPAYTMRGNRGVMVRRTNGKQLLIGSQRPEQLVAAIRSATTQGPPSGA
jgi:hypothetical protein